MSYSTRTPDRTASSRAVDAGAFDYPAETAEPERRFDYSFGLARILDGVDTLIRQRGGAGAS
ncbi:hypothetical protein LDL49_08830 [Nonomuraea sp. NEAU-L178]|nr:hypothetical protein [Nonomuraea aurantiaca]